MDASTSEKPEWALTKRDRKRIERAKSGKPARRKWPIFVVLALLAVAGYAAWQFQAAPSEAQSVQVTPEPTEAVMRLAQVDVTTIAPQTLSQRVKVTGTTRPLQRATLTAEVSGAATEVNFRPGDAVQSGDVLVQINVRDLQLSLDQATANLAATQSQLDLAERQLQSAQALVDRGLTANSNLETAQATVVSNRAQLAALQTQVEAAEVALAKATVRAPFDGTISSRSVEPNQSIAAGAELMGLVDLSRIEVQANAPLTQAIFIEPGQPVELTVESNSSRVFEGTVDRVNPVATEGTRSISLFATLDNPDGFLKGGMFATGDVIVASKADAIAVPAAAIQEDRDGKFVLKVVDGSVTRQAVEPGQVWGDSGTTEITNGLVAGDTIVNTTLERLLPGARVAVAGAN